jgi:3-hydroxyisobutyrate dehydrogenase-like beta-hydroxyacid dehydrogenase
MGFPMAGHLSAAGHDVCVFNRTASRAAQWLEDHQGSVARTPRVAAEGAEFVFACVGNDADLSAVTLGSNGAFAGMSPGAVFVDHTTTSARIAREMAAHADVAGLEFIDAPVSGGQSGAEQGSLTVMCGGRDSAFQRARVPIGAYSRTCILLGASGSGQLTKMVNQICIAGLLQGLAEGLNFGTAAGLDMTKAVSVIAHGAAQSWQLDNRAATMIDGEFAFGFAVDWMRKDLGFALDTARQLGAPLPLTALVDQFYGQLQQRGDNRLDTSSLIKLLQNAARE